MTLTKQEKKVELRKQVGRTHKLGTYELTITKVADKKVTFNESVNGLKHVHTWFEIEEAYDYLFHKLLVNGTLTSKRTEIDTKFASAEFKNQKRAYDDIVETLQRFIESSTDCSHTTEFIDEKHIRLTFSPEYSIDILIRDVSEETVFIRLNAASDIAMTYNDAQVIVSLAELQKLNWQMTDDSDIFIEMLHRYHDMKLQLNKFTVGTSQEVNFPIESQDIIDFVNIAQDDDSMIQPLVSINDRRRSLHIVRQSRIKYLIEFRNYRKVPDGSGGTVEIMQEEYWFHISKFSSNFTDNIKRIKTAYEALA